VGGTESTFTIKGRKKGSIQQALKTTYSAETTIGPGKVPKDDKKKKKRGNNDEWTEVKGDPSGSVRAQIWNLLMDTSFTQAVQNCGPE